MKVVFCLDDKPQYLLLLKGAVRSLRAVHGQNVPCLAVYGGDNAEVIRAIEAENLPLARHTPVLNRENMAPCTHRVMGAFLKLELALLPELASDEFVLYCDTDVFFNQPLSELEGVRPQYLGMAREQRPRLSFPTTKALLIPIAGRNIPCPCLFPFGLTTAG